LNVSKNLGLRNATAIFRREFLYTKLRAWCLVTDTTRGMKGRLSKYHSSRSDAPRIKW